jgi:hypothetical protein
LLAGILPAAVHAVSTSQVTIRDVLEDLDANGSAIGVTFHF